MARYLPQLIHEGSQDDPHRQLMVCLDPYLTPVGHQVHVGRRLTSQGKFLSRVLAQICLIRDGHRLRTDRLHPKLAQNSEGALQRIPGVAAVAASIDPGTPFQVALIHN